MATLLRGARIACASVPDWRAMLGMRPSLEDPTTAIRDPWPGDPGSGARLMRGELRVGAAGKLMLPEEWTMNADDDLRAAAHGFSWLRDLRALGTDGARARARLLVSNWLETVAADRVVNRADVIGARLAAWLGHYDFFAASAGERFRARVMAQVQADGRALAARVPCEPNDARALAALKGLIAAAIALPERGHWLKRALRLLPEILAGQMLDDGGHCERSPVAHLRALQELVEIRALLQTGGLPPQPALASAIERLALGLGSLRHLDGGLALFNGSREEDPALIDFVLGQARRPMRGFSAQPVAGFRRLQAGRTLMLIDAAAPPPPGRDRLSHAGTLSFEISIGRDRMIVNCGAVLAAGEAWTDALRATAAHSTLTIENTNSAQFSEGHARRPMQVQVQAEDANGAHWLELSHDGYTRPFGAIHRRRLYMAESGEDIRGEDIVDCPVPVHFAVRFHLHPAVSAELQHDTVLLRLASGGLWRLRVDGGTLALEESLYLGSADRQESQQLVATSGADNAQSLKWAITKVG